MTSFQHSEFYEFCFPHSSKHTNNDFQYAFTNYGCFENINLRFDETKRKFLFHAAKQKLMASDKDSTDIDKIFFPSHPALPLGNPETICKLLSFPTEKDLAHKRRPVRGDGSNNKVKNYAYVERHIANFAMDHPDAAQGTFLRLLSQYFPFFLTTARSTNEKILPGREAQLDCNHKLPHKFLPKFNCGSKTISFPSHVSPYMFDIPLPLLNKLLLEEIMTEASKVSYDLSHTGGTLSYKHIDSKKDFNYGFLFRSGGKEMSDLSVQLICTNKRHEIVRTQEFAPNLHLGSDYRFSLNGRILQIDAQCSFDGSSRFNVGTRTMHHAMMSMVDGRKTSLILDDDDNYKLLSFSSPKCVEHVSVFRSARVVNSIAVSPYLDGECFLGLDDGKVYLWNARLHSNVDTEQSCDNSGGFVLVRKSATKGSVWNQVGFGSHPRQAFVASKTQVNLIDIRGQNTSETSFAKCSSDDRVMTILSGNSFTRANEFQCAVATTRVIDLYDVRYHKVPLLEWGVNLRTPCQHLAVIGSAHDGATFNLNSVLLAASDRSQEIHMYQYNTKSRPTNSLLQVCTGQQSMQPPTSTAPPYACETFKDFRRSLTRRLFRSQGHLDQRLSYPIVGITGFEYKTPMGESRIVTLHASECGDVLYQTLDSCDPQTIWKEDNVTSGLLGSTVTKAKIKEVEDRADEIRFAWASTVDKNYRQAVGKRPAMDLRCSRTTLNTVEFDQKRLVREIMFMHRKKPPGDCVACEAAGSVRSKSRFNNDDDDEVASDSSTSSFGGISFDFEDGKCAGCGSQKDHASMLFESRRQGTFHPSNLKNDDVLNDTCYGETIPKKWKRPQVEPLTLVNPAPLKKGLGGVLCSTWDGSYEDYWDSMRKDFEKANKIREQKKREGLLDAAAPSNEVESGSILFEFEESLGSQTRAQLPIDKKLSSDMADLLVPENREKKTVFNNLLETDFSDIQVESDGGLSGFESSAKRLKLSPSVPASSPARPEPSNIPSPSLFEDECLQSTIRSMLTREKSATEAMIFGSKIEPTEPLSILSTNNSPRPALASSKSKSLKKKRQIGFF